MALQTKTLTANGSKGHHKFTLTVDENSTSTSGNTSSLSFSFKLSPLQNGWDWYSYGTRISYSININGQVFSGYISQYDGSSTVTLSSSSLTVTHNDDGNKSINISFSVSDSSGASYTCGNASSSTTMTLTFIPRKSSVSATNANIGSNTTISINRASSSFTHTLKYSFSGLSGTIVSKTSSTSVSWTVPTTFYTKIPNAKSGTCTITCETYSGNTLIGSSTCTFTASVVNSNPNFSSSQITYLDSNTTITNITGNNQHIVRNLSNLKVTFTSATGKNSATISKYEVTFNGSTKTLTSAGTIDYGAVNLSQNTSISIKVTDSRGNSTTVSKTITILDWVLPSAVLTYGRVNNYEDETKLKVQVSISSVNGKNSIQSIQYRYKKTTDTSYSSYANLSNNTETTLSLDKLYAWDFQVVIKDKFGTKTYNFVLAKGIPIMFIDIDLKSVGVNCFPTSESSFAVNGSEFLEYEIVDEW